MFNLPTTVNGISYITVDNVSKLMKSKTPKQKYLDVVTYTISRNSKRDSKLRNSVLI